MSAAPDEVISLPNVNQCHHCQADLTEVAVKTIERRQVMDVPIPPPLQVTKYARAMGNNVRTVKDIAAQSGLGASQPPFKEHGTWIEAMAVETPTTQQLLSCVTPS